MTPPDPQQVAERQTAREAIKRAAPYIDADSPPTKWKPSELLTIGWGIIATGRGGMEAADTFVADMLAEARHRWAAGFKANPFAEPAELREIVSHG